MDSLFFLLILLSDLNLYPHVLHGNKCNRFKTLLTHCAERSQFMFQHVVEIWLNGLSKVNGILKFQCNTPSVIDWVISQLLLSWLVHLSQLGDDVNTLQWLPATILTVEYHAAVCYHTGRTTRQKWCLRKSYHQIWQPIVYQVPLYCWDSLFQQFRWYYPKHNEFSQIKTSLFCYETTYSLSTYVHRPIQMH